MSKNDFTLVRQIYSVMPKSTFSSDQRRHRHVYGVNNLVIDSKYLLNTFSSLIVPLQQPNLQLNPLKVTR